MSRANVAGLGPWLLARRMPAATVTPSNGGCAGKSPLRSLLRHPPAIDPVDDPASWRKPPDGSYLAMIGTGIGNAPISIRSRLPAALSGGPRVEHPGWEAGLERFPARRQSAQRLTASITTRRSHRPRIDCLAPSPDRLPWILAGGRDDGGAAGVEQVSNRAPPVRGCPRRKPRCSSRRGRGARRGRGFAAGRAAGDHRERCSTALATAVA